MTLPFRAESGGTVQVTISGHNQTTLQSTIAVTPQGSPYVHVSSPGRRQRTRPVAGNGDGVLDAGERSSSTSPASMMAGRGERRDWVCCGFGPWATITDSTLRSAPWAKRRTASALQDLFTVAPNAPDGTVST